MASKFRAASIYVKNRRFKFQTDGSLQMSDGSEAIIIEGGYENHSTGPLTSQVQMNRAVPVGGDGSNLEEYFVEQEEVEITMGPINGKLVTIKPMRITEASFAGDHRNGTQTGSITLMGGKPKITG
jgi:hypothetical protein